MTMYPQYNVSTDQKSTSNLLNNTTQLLGQVLNTIPGFGIKSLLAVPNWLSSPFYS